MPEVFVLRHSIRVENEDRLSVEGREKATSLSKRFKKSEVVISSPRRRAMETAILLSGQLLEIRDAADQVDVPDVQLAYFMRTKGLSTSAEAIFSDPYFRKVAMIKGYELFQLIKCTLHNLSDDGIGLIVSHDSPMIAARNTFIGARFEDGVEPKVQLFAPLNGFSVRPLSGNHLFISDFSV